MKSILTALLALLSISVSSAYKVHVKNPWPGTPMWTTLRIISSVIAGPPGAAMTDDGDGWYSYTVADNLATNATFMVVMYPPASYDATQPDYAGQQNFTMNGISKSGTEFSVGGLKAIAPDVWIIPKGGTTPPLITDIPVAKKVAILFNPWPDNAPTAKVGGATTYSNMYMSPDSKRCGWYGAYFFGAPYTVAFKSLFGSDSYGIAGMGDAKAIDLTSYFATSDTLFLVPDPIPGGPPKILTSMPVGVSGTCSFKLAVTVRDFSTQHPDFEKADMASDVANLGLVTNDLGTDGKPVKSAKGIAYNHMSDFSHWFADDSTAAAPLTNYTSCQDLPMTKSNGGLWGYDSFKSEASHSYFPIDGAFDHFPAEATTSQYIDPSLGTAKNDPTGAKHNFSFCMEMHASFKYKQGQQFNFVGDDDVWAYINNKLVMDLGGPHPPLPGKVDLDKLGLTQGTDYPFDFFFCERHTTGSDLTIQTSIFFEQQQSVFTKVTDLPGGGKQYDIYERTSGSHNCGASTTDQVALAKSEFKLSGPSVNPAAVLPVGPSYVGIVINPGQTQVTINPDAIVGLKGGLYTITYTTTSGKGSTLQFTVPSKNAIEFSAKVPVNVILGTSVPVAIQALAADKADARVETFRLTPQAGLLVYKDTALTLAVTATTDLTTDANGAAKVFVTSQTPGTYKLDLVAALSTGDTYNNLTFIQQPKAAKPVATPAGENFLAPIKVTLVSATPGATILYTLDGTTPAEVAGGSTLAYPAAGIPLDKSATIKAIAVFTDWKASDVMTEAYAYTPPVAVQKAWYKDLNGDGMIETVILDFDKDLSAVPAKLTFKITDQNIGTNDRTPLPPAEVAFAAGSKTRIIVTLATPFPYGVTSVTNRDLSGQVGEQINIPLLAQTFPVDDSVAPVLSKPFVTESDSLHPLKRIRISISEGVDFPLTSQTALIFKRDGAEVPTASVKIDHIEKVGDRDYQVYIDSNSTLFPIVGDSVALNNNGEIKDPAKNTPAQKTFQLMDGIVPEAKPMEISVKFPKGDGSHATAGLEPQGPYKFIPIGLDNTPLSGNAADGKCPDCYAGEGANFVGPVFNMIIAGPMDYDFKIFNNLGEFVASGKGSISKDDLQRLKPNGSENYVSRIVWTGRTDDGGKAATGVYILQTTLTGTKDLRTGAPAAKTFRRIRFGMLRG